MKVILAVCSECIRYGRQAQVVAINAEDVDMKKLEVWCGIHRKVDGIQVDGQDSRR